MPRNRAAIENNQSINIAIISGYSEQKKLLNHLINPKDNSRWKCLSFEIDNVDAFQGQERDIVIYSIVCSNTRKDIGFFRDYRRLNVAISRARKLLILIGDHEMVQTAVTGKNRNYFPDVLKYITKSNPENCVLEVR